MKDKTILGAWCSEPNCIFIDNKHIQTKVMVHIWYSYDGDSKTDVMNKEISFVKEIDFDEFNNIVEIIEEEKKIPVKIKIDNEDRIQALSTGNFVYKVNQPTKNIIYKINEIIDYLKSKGD